MSTTTIVSQFKPILYFSAAVISIVILGTLIVLGMQVFPAVWLLMFGVVILGGVIFLILWQQQLDFPVLFLGLVIIGFFQDFISRLSAWSLPEFLWGGMKYGLLFLMVIGLGMRLICGRNARANKAMLAWLSIWLLTWLVMSIFILEAVLTPESYSPVSTIQIFGLGNMLLAILVYFEARPHQLTPFLKILIYFGIAAAMFGILQRILGPTRLAALRLMPDGGGPFDFLNANTPETGFRDLQSGLRAFSFFYSHHAFSAFLILTTVALQVLRYQKRVNKAFYIPAISIMLFGMALSFNITNILTIVLILILYYLLENNNSLSSLIHFLRKKRVWKALGLSLVVAGAAIVSIEPIRNRFLSIFDLRDLAGAGGSLSGRISVFYSGLKAVIDYPMGFGLALGGTREYLGYARVNNYFESQNLLFTSDNWFQWLMVQTGIPVFLLYSMLFVIPLIWSWRSRRYVQDPDLKSLLNGLFALFLFTFLFGISNSPILSFSPSNLIIWSVAGCLMKIPVWDLKRREALDDAHRD